MSQTLSAAASRREPRRLKIVHTSDVHLDATVAASRNGRVRSPGEIGLDRVIERVHGEAADLLLIAGDLFDSGRVGSGAVDFAMGALARVPCPVVLMPGNHDCYDDESIYRSVDLRDAGSHVYTLMTPDGEVLEFPELEVTVWGRAMVSHDGRNRPLDGVPERRGHYWHVGMAHGLVSDDPHEHRSSLIRSEEIAGSGLDYLALGHVHVFRDVSAPGTKACYSGSPVAVHSEAVGSVAVIALDPVKGVVVEVHRF